MRRMDEWIPWGYLGFQETPLEKKKLEGGDYLTTGFICVFILIIVFIAIAIFFQNTFFRLFISLEYKYNKLQFAIRISSIEVHGQKLRISTSCPVYQPNLS